MLLKLNGIYSKIFGKNKLCFIIEKLELHFRVKTYYDNITAKIHYKSTNNKQL
jgi:hypothetical protein